MADQQHNVTLVGQVNVGKSNLFNSLIGSRRAIVAREAHTTRDSVESLWNIGRTEVRLVDSAGFGPDDSPFASIVNKHRAEDLRATDLFLMVVDSSLGCSQTDQQIVSALRKYKKPIILILNKSDRKVDQATLDSYKRLGVDDVVAVSAIHKIGIHELQELVSSRLESLSSKSRKSKDSSGLKLAFIGKPNAGKSSLHNALTHTDSAIVSEQAGTTRDVKYASLAAEGTSFTLADTAGIRRKSKIELGIELFAAGRARDAITWADVCILLLDSGDALSRQDLRLAQLIAEAGKGLIIAVNKSDLLTEEERNILAARITREYSFVWWAPLVFISAVTGQNTEVLLEQASAIYARAHQHISTATLNKLLTEITHTHPVSSAFRVHPKLNYVTQTDEAPPTFTIFGSHVNVVHFSYRRYIENKMREAFDFGGTPIKLLLKDKRSDETNRRAR